MGFIAWRERVREDKREEKENEEEVVVFVYMNIYDYRVWGLAGLVYFFLMMGYKKARELEESL